METYLLNVDSVSSNITTSHTIERLLGDLGHTFNVSHKLVGQIDESRYLSAVKVFPVPGPLHQVSWRVAGKLKDIEPVQ